MLLWDGTCGFCHRWVARVERWDRAGRIETLVAGKREKYPELLRITDDALNHALHLAMPDGRVLAGGRAVPEIFRRLPAWRWLAWVFRVPGVLWVTDRVYAWVAARRHKLGCALREK